MENILNCNSISRVIVFNTPLKYAKIKVVDNQNYEITNSCLFSWSADGVCYSEFTSYENYNSICSSIDSDFFLRILFKGSLGGVYVSNAIVTCYSIFLHNPDPYITEYCDTTAIDFYSNIDCAVRMQTSISDKIICSFGIPCYYFHVSPDDSTRDLTFKEYVLHNVEDVKILKLMLNDGQMPSSKPVFTEFDFDWETDWEVEISKTHFANAFGDTVFPNQRDMVYIPMMRRMYEVNSAYCENAEALMWRGTTWKLGLIKWNEKTNIDYNKFEDIIDEWAKNRYDDVFSSESNEQDTQSGITQNRIDEYNQNNIRLYLSDAVRHSSSVGLNIVDFDIYNSNILVAKNIYNMVNPDDYIKYIKTICGENGTLSFIMNTNNVPANISIEKTLIHFGEIKINVRTDDSYIYVSDSLGTTSKLMLGGLYIINYVWNRRNFTAQFIIYNHVLNTRYESFPKYKIRSDMYRFVHYDTSVGKYNNDYIMTSPQECVITPHQIPMTNIKLYSSALDRETLEKEILKFSTKHASCVINDNCVPINNDFGSYNK